MSDIKAAGALTTGGRQAAESPLVVFEARLDVQDDVSSHLTELGRYGVVSRQWAEIRDYLEQHRDLTPLLTPICEQVRKEFRPPDELAIQLYRDPEIKDEYLTLYIRQPRYDANIMARIERLSDAFSERLEHASGYLLLTTDFSAPRGSNAL